MITTLFFDLGNVLLFFDHHLIERNLRMYSKEKNEGNALFANSEFNHLLQQYELGLIESYSFFHRVKGMCKILDADLSFEKFKKLWSNIFWCNSRLINLLEKQKGKYKLGMISNTNELHIEYVKKKFPDIFKFFSVHIFSHEIHCAKPSEEVYRIALKKIDSAPDECIYFDDIIRYVNAASVIGIHAHQYVSYCGCEDILNYYDVI